MYSDSVASEPERRSSPDRRTQSAFIIKVLARSFWPAAVVITLTEISGYSNLAMILGSGVYCLFALWLLSGQRGAKGPHGQSKNRM